MMILRTHGILLALAAFAAWPSAMVHAQAGAYSRMGFGARGIAMSNALGADASGAASAYYNPALAPFATGQALNGTVALMSLDRQLQFLEFTTPLRPRAGITAGLIHAAVTGIDGRDESGYHTQDHRTDEFAFFLAFGTRLSDRFAAGASFQIFRADFFEGVTATNGIGIDVGAIYQATDALSVGFAIEDLLARYTWDTSGAFGAGGKTTRDNFPTRVRISGAYSFLEGQGRIAAEYEAGFVSREHRSYDVRLSGGIPRESASSERLTRHASRLRVGAEYLLTEIFGLRAGVDQLSSETGEVKPTAGFMIRQPVGELMLTADYAFVLEPHAVSSLHFITLSVGL